MGLSPWFAVSAGPQPETRSWKIWVPLQPHFEKRIVNRAQRGVEGSLCQSGSFNGQALPLIGKERLFIRVDSAGDSLCLWFSPALGISVWQLIDDNGLEILAELSWTFMVLLLALCSALCIIICSLFGDNGFVL
jgi:hypothetical protein